MITSLRLGLTGQSSCRMADVQRIGAIACLALALTTWLGCGRDSPPATVEGTLLVNGRPVDNCLVTFLPEPGQEGSGRHSTGLSDQRGYYRLRHDDQQEGVTVGRHRVILQDLSVSTGVRRRDHGTVDARLDETIPPPPARQSRVPATYLCCGPRSGASEVWRLSDNRFPSSVAAAPRRSRKPSR